MRPSLLDRLREIVGAAYVLTAPEDTVVYEQDAFLVARAHPDAVVLPGSAEEVAADVGTPHLEEPHARPVGHDEMAVAVALTLVTGLALQDAAGRYRDGLVIAVGLEEIDRPPEEQVGPAIVARGRNV